MRKTITDSDLSIGLFNDSYPPVMDGVAVAVRNYAYWLSKKGEKVKVITPKTPEEIKETEFELLRYASLPLINRKPYRFGMPYVDIVFLNKLFIKSKFKIVHAHCPFSSGHMALYTAKVQKIPIVATFHSKYRDDFERVTKSRKAANTILKTIMPFFDHADEVWIPQAAVEETIREYGYKGKVEVVNNGTDLTPDAPIAEVKSEARKKMNIGEDEFIFLFVGQHIWEKNTRTIIESLELLKDLPFKMFFVGTGYAENEMKALVTEKKLDDKVIFTGNIYDRDSLKNHYAAADLFLFPSLYDNAPLVIREAAALHTPSIVVEDSTTAEIFKDNVNGFLIKNSPEALAEKIRIVTQDKNIIFAVGENASRTIARSWENIADEVLDRYKNLIARKC
ncbi:MAG: glycosyltransferase family 4 protein [Porphyromonadaceae bacterium]|nr:glycosyltransferase family 4 protein [Porphyromonadaceae bacterium]